MGSNALKVEVQSPIIKEAPPTLPTRVPIPKLEPLKALQASASLGKDGRKLVITIVNQSLDEDLETEIRLIGSGDAEKGKLSILNAGDVRDHNDFDAPNKVAPSEELVKMQGKTLNYIAPRHSINGFTFALK